MLKFDLWLIVGFTGQALFSMRFLIQWIKSEREKRSTIPIAFWYFSLAGGASLLVYAIHRKDPVFILGQASGLFIYNPQSVPHLSGAPRGRILNELRMRIAYLTSLFMPFLGGAEIFLHHLAADMTHRGHHAVVIAPGSKKHRHAFEMPYTRVPALRARSKRFLVGNALPSLLAAHMFHHFDLVHCQGEYHETVAAEYFKRLTGTPYVCRPIGGGFTNVEQHPKLQNRLAKALSGAELVFAQGAFLKRRILNHGIAEKKIVTIHNGVRIDEVRRYRNNRPVVDPPYLFYAGGLKPVKGYDVAG